jgi:small subunit ribosomal protein S20
MPHSSSAKKRARQYAKRRLYNRSYKKAINTAIKDFDAAAKSGGANANDAFTKAIRKLDMAAARKVIHPNKAARKKAQLAKAFAAQSKGGSAVPAK